MSFDRVEDITGLPHKTEFYIAYGKMFFFLLIHFLVVGVSKFPKSISHVLSVPLTLECVRILF